MDAVAIVTSLALMQVAYFAFMVGAARQKYGAPAPAMTGPEEFLRAFRVHMNTVENIVIFIPAMWLFGYFIDPMWAAGIGVVFIISRFMYRSAYLKDPSGRSLAFGISFLVNTVLVVGTIVKASMNLLSS